MHFNLSSILRRHFFYLSPTSYVISVHVLPKAAGKHWPRLLSVAGVGCPLWASLDMCSEKMLPQGLFTEKIFCPFPFPLNCPDCIFAILKVSLAYLLVCLGCYHRKHRLVGLTDICFLILLAGMSKIKGPVDLVSGKSFFLGIQMADFSLCSHMAFPQSVHIERGSSLTSSPYKATNPIIGAHHSYPNLILITSGGKSPPPTHIGG